MKTTRQAIMTVSRQLLEDLLPDWWTAVQLPHGDLLKQVLKLPANCQITNISQVAKLAANTSVFFYNEQIAIRVECPDFVETPAGALLPEVLAIYQSPTGLVKESYFLFWDGPAVATKRVYGPDGKEMLGG